MEKTNINKQKQLFQSSKNIFKTAWSIDKSHFLLMLLGIIFTSILPFILAWLLNELINTIVAVNAHEQTKEDLYIVLAGFGITTILLIIGYNIVAYSDTKMRFAIERTFNRLINTKLTTLDISSLEDPKFIDLKTKATDTYSWRPQSFLSNLFYGLQNIIQIVASIGIIFSLGPLWFTLIILSFIPNMVANIKFSKVQWSIWDTDTEVRRKYGYITWMLGYKNALMEIRLFRAEKFFLNKLLSLVNTYIRRNEKLEDQKMLFLTITNILPSIVTIAVLVHVALQASNGLLNIGLLTFYYSTLSEFTQSTGSFVQNMSKAYEHSMFIDDMYRFINYPNKVYFRTKGKKLQLKQAPLIEFKNVSFRYPDSHNYVFKHFNLAINPGENIALIGENGAGKTTLIKMLVQFYEPESGEILVNGVNLKDVNPDFWFDQISILTQSFVQYDFTIRENIALSNLKKIGDEKYMETAAIQANALEFIKKFKTEFDQQLGKEFSEGEELSGGQWQRLALARAFFKKEAPILILDEPTSAIDAKAEAEIFGRLNKFAKDKTIIFISHRFSTVRNADRIVVLEKGKILQEGSHQKLIKQEGRYKEMFEIQAKGYK